VKTRHYHIVYLSLGSNVSPRKETLLKAIQLIQKKYGIDQEALVSPSYESPPWGFQADTNFINLCVRISTTKSPREILQINQSIERSLGRKPKELLTYESRPIDIDILFYDDYLISEEGLTIPHPCIPERRFVLQPLNDIARGFLHISLNKTIEELLSLCSDTSSLIKIGEING
jgi:2-amino-4-hydroxy-6-hydroxymethyldihydropteridine diphosphokinase